MSDFGLTPDTVVVEVYADLCADDQLQICQVHILSLTCQGVAVAILEVLLSFEFDFCDQLVPGHVMRLALTFAWWEFDLYDGEWYVDSCRVVDSFVPEDA